MGTNVDEIEIGLAECCFNCKNSSISFDDEFGDCIYCDKHDVVVSYFYVCDSFEMEK